MYMYILERVIPDEKKNEIKMVKIKKRLKEK